MRKKECIIIAVIAAVLVFQTSIMEKRAFSAESGNQYWGAVWLKCTANRYNGYEGLDGWRRMGTSNNVYRVFIFDKESAKLYERDSETRRLIMMNTYRIDTNSIRWGYAGYIDRVNMTYSDKGTLQEPTASGANRWEDNGVCEIIQPMDINTSPLHGPQTPKF